MYGFFYCVVRFAVNFAELLFIVYNKSMRAYLFFNYSIKPLHVLTKNL